MVEDEIVRFSANRTKITEITNESLNRKDLAEQDNLPRQESQMDNYRISRAIVPSMYSAPQKRSQILVDLII
ncbi:uncharacterized protein OCT59_028984 [Rhizophagus irregularis]|uniref:uncharacterized protein n=1 Tax=Rhizophagus irregularis TaxID=588596 RepID=UPI00332EB381|nr:hypothetical protein OCT59_028984 [Rhizophagus irregularis]